MPSALKPANIGFRQPKLKAATSRWMALETMWPGFCRYFSHHGMLIGYIECLYKSQSSGLHHVLSCFIMFYHVLSCFIMFYHVLSCFIPILRCLNSNVQWLEQACHFFLQVSMLRRVWAEGRAAGQKIVDLWGIRIWMKHKKLNTPQSIHIWGFLKMGVPQARWMVYFMENPYWNGW